MEKRVVISQSMYFPWVGLFEQIRLADVFVHYDDVQFTRGSFSNRVQVKTSQGLKWATVPLQDHQFGQNINEVLISDRNDWRSQHRELLRQAYFKAPFRDDMLALLDRVFAQPATTLADISRASIIELANYFNLVDGKAFIDSTELKIGGSGSQRVHDIVLALDGNVYVTGHGGRNYLEHHLFEQSSIAVKYMQYRCIPYTQLHGEFTPYVTGLDLIANCGVEGAYVIQSEAKYWQDFTDTNNQPS
ncbi:hypothetical protein MTYM_00906 [Methylococcales bacterium]|nr:hypothetical protein MTYM_00906 [Methylococcales bacterium]